MFKPKKFQDYHLIEVLFALQIMNSDASKFRDWLMEESMSLSTVKRVFLSVKAIINLTIQEHRLDINNPFSKTFMPEIDDKQYR